MARATLLLCLVLLWSIADPTAAQPMYTPPSDDPDPDTVLGFIVIAAGAAGYWWWKRRRRNETGRALLERSALDSGAPLRHTQEEPAPRASSSNTPSATGSVFISYRRGDAGDVVGRIYDRLVERFGRPNVFKDVDSIPLGVDFRSHLSESVGKCRVLIAVISRGWLQQSDGERRISEANDFVRIEVEAALQRNIPVIPVLVQGAALPKENELPATLKELAYRNATVVRADPDFHADIARLIEGIAFHLDANAGARPVSRIDQQ